MQVNKYYYYSMWIANNRMPARSRSRNFRLSTETIQAITAEAKGQGVSVNALVGQVLDEHLESAKYTRYNMVSLPGRTLSRLYEIMTDEQIDRAVDEFSSNNPKDFLLRNKLDTNIDGLIKYFSEYCSQTRLGTYEVAHQKDRTHVTIWIPHGPGLTKAVGKMVSQTFRKVAGVEAAVATTEQTVGFSVPESKNRETVKVEMQWSPTVPSTSATRA
jgi:hypothetical protein